MEYQDFRAIGFATLLAAASLWVSDGRAAQDPHSKVITPATEAAELQIAVPRSRPDIEIALLRNGDITATGASVGDAQPAVRLPRPRPVYFDMRIDMTDMLGEEELAGVSVEERFIQARRPHDDDLQGVN